ncbi:prepilin peptidase [Streptomyces sp. NPDC046161]|uniref:prepilin peptidase n=1 Tax=Streptomyces sp. NPDC046161 TaxID=3155132 RepID=UPI00340B8CEE
MGLAVIILAAVYGVTGGLLLPRAAYRLSVEPDRPWRDRCPEGHPLPGWLGLARCRGGLDSPAAPEAPGAPAGPLAPTAPGAPAPPHPTAPATPAPVRPGARAAAVPPHPDTLVSPGSAHPETPTPPASPHPDTPATPAPVRPGAPAPSGGTPPVRTPPGGSAPMRPHAYGPSSARTAALSGAVCAALAAAGGPRPEVAVFVALAPALVLLALVDLAVHRLPDPLTLPLAALTAALLGGAALLPGAAGSWRLALLGGAALGASYLVLFLINPAGMGFGDVKLALSLGVALGWYGWGVWIAGAFLGFLYGAAYGLTLVLRGRGGLKAAIPFGPFMAAGAFTGMLLGGFGA